MSGSSTAPSTSGLRHGAFALGDGTTRFSVWAPKAARVELVVDDKTLGALGAEHDGYHVASYPVGPGARYRYLLDGRGPFADPASRSQPDGVHGASKVVAPRRADAVAGWRGLVHAAQVICEIHVGTFSAAGTFDGVADALPDLVEAGYSALELMPVGAFPGARNWGYDGVFPFAVQDSYGGREGLGRLCEAAHRAGVAVICDVVYNHFGPEGAVFAEYGPYLTERYRTPWGEAVNFDDDGSDEVRRFFVEHGLSLVRELGVDGFRLDAVHEIADASASPFVAEYAAAMHAEARRLGRVITVVAESPDNDPRLVAAAEAGGIGFDGVWNDDFHHCLRVSFTGQHDRYFGDYRGVADLSTAFTEGFVVAGRVAPSRGRRHGARPRSPIAGDRLVVFAQNHDQIGNGGFGRRLADELPFDAQFPIAAAVLLSGNVPLRFMGEEYGETAPFHFFIDHGDQALIAAVRDGRRREIGEQSGVEPPDADDPATFEMCRLDPARRAEPRHAELLAFNRQLIALRREHPALGSLEPDRSACYFDEEARAFALVRRAHPFLAGRPVAFAANLSAEPIVLAPPLLADCRLDVLVARRAGDASNGGRITPSTAGEVLVSLDGFGVLVATVVEPAGSHRLGNRGDRLGVIAPPR